MVSADFTTQVRTALEGHREHPALAALDEGTLTALAEFCTALVRANEQLNLTRITAPEDMAVLHVLDALSAAAFLGDDPDDPAAAGRPLVDLGTGGGVPGLPLALVMPRRPVVLIDSRGKKARAVQAMVAELGLGRRVRVEAVRGEAWLAARPPQAPAVDVVTRAVGALQRQLELLGPVRHEIARLVVMKGPAGDDERAALDPPADQLGWELTHRDETELPGEAGRRVILVWRPLPTPRDPSQPRRRRR